jgi:hypothetical protein
MGYLRNKHRSFARAAQVTQEDDQVFGISGLHEIRPKVEPLQNDYLGILGRDAVQFIQTNYAWYFTLFGYRVSPI